MARETNKNEMTLDPELVELAAGGKKKKGEKAEKVAAPAQAEKPTEKSAKAEKPAKGEKAAEKATEAAAEEAPKVEAPKVEEPKVACFISKRSYPISETVELKYKNQTVRVAKSLVKFQVA